MSQESGKLRHPYSISLTHLLQDHFQAAPVVVDTADVWGECVVPSMTRRLDRLLREASEPYDWVLILGGTNDLDCGLRAEQLIPHLLGLHDRAKKNAPTRTLALAIPQIANELETESENYRREKAEVNERLRVYCQESAGSSLFVDLWSGLPFGSLPAEERGLYWADDFHMTARGYDKMAALIFDCLKHHI